MRKADGVIDMVLNADTKIQLQALNETLGISEEDVYAAVGLNPRDINGEVADERLTALLTLCNNVRPWFDSPADAWRWFTSQPLSGFGGKTPAAIICDDGAVGGRALMLFIESKQLGGFD